MLHIITDSWIFVTLCKGYFFKRISSLIEQHVFILSKLLVSQRYAQGALWCQQGVYDNSKKVLTSKSSHAG